jgi:hypothetical protein
MNWWRSARHGPADDLQPGLLAAIPDGSMLTVKAARNVLPINMMGVARPPRAAASRPLNQSRREGRREQIEQLVRISRSSAAGCHR